MFFHPENPTPSEIRYIFAAKTDHDSYALVQKDHREYDMIISVIEDTYREFDEKNVGYELMLRANTSRLYTVFMRLSDTSEQTQISYDNSNMAEAAAKALSYIEKNYDRQIGMMDVAESCHISYSYFSRNFSKWTGVKFNDYLLNFRINKARKLLLCSSESITSISISCGFENISYFIKKFRQVTGYTPKDFRNQYKNF
jgi:YesN/AraC family two-component response regulator